MGLATVPNKYKNAWGPSIDTLLFCRALRRFDKKFFNGKSIIEIGAGSGFISKYVLEKFPTVSDITIVDLNPSAILSCKDNIKDPRAKFVAGSGIDYIKGKKFDLIICNPPYIPRPKSVDGNPYEGIGLIKYIISHARENLNLGGKIITNLSSISFAEIEKEIKTHGLAYKKTDKMIVPLKVCNVLNNRKWMRFLMNRGLRRKFRKGYEYFHTIAILLLEPKSPEFHG